MVVCLERGVDLHMAQLMPLPLTVSCFSKIQIGFTFLVPAYPGSPGKRAVQAGRIDSFDTGFRCSTPFRKIVHAMANGNSNGVFTARELN